MWFLITGGAGFLGSALANYLAEAGHQVRVLDALVKEMMRKIGSFCYAREDVRIVPSSKKGVIDSLMEGAPAKIASVRVVGVNNTDDVKYHLQDDSWLLIRPSGTEPLLRIYAEGRDWDQVATLLAAGRKLTAL